MEQNVKYFDCSCGSEILRLEYDKDVGMLYISIYELKRNWGLCDRLRHILKIIKTGTPYGDQMCFKKKEAREISKLIKEVTKG